MANLRIGDQNHADTATITANPVALLGAITHVQNDARGDIFGGTATSQEIKLTWGGTAKTISQLTLWRLNLAYNDTIAPVYYPNADWTGSALYNPGASNAYESGLFDDWGWSFVNRYHTPIASVKSVKITIAAASAPQASRLYLGPYTEAEINPAYGATFGWETNSTQNRSHGGSLRSMTKATWRSAAFDMMVSTEAYRAVWAEIARKVDISKSFVASLYPGDGGTVERDHTIFGKFERSPAMKISGPNAYDFSVKILEL